MSSLPDSSSQHEPEVRDNEALSRYELEVDGIVAFLTYRRSQSVLVLVHTEVPDVLRDRNLGGLLAKHALDAGRGADLRIVVRCPFVAAWISRHPEYAEPG
jgi:predicted GNAT family acetyltransferase